MDFMLEAPESEVEEVLLSPTLRLSGVVLCKTGHQFATTFPTVLFKGQSPLIRYPSP